ncbi:meiosis initiator protein isoform X1 [Anolis carolinensis]|uniref:meiosis initiator protein isoform X1 n=1 Tax=Anolis carolinensis TaxID=28377 RepID=UPI002F2B74BB
MWDQTGRACSEELRAKSKNLKHNSDDRNKRNAIANTLKELAEMLPIPLRTGCKRLTKKEVLLRVLRYIEHLQANIDTAKSLLQVKSGEPKAKETEPVVIPTIKRRQREATPLVKKTKPSNVFKKPRKRRRSHRTERQGGNKRACKLLTLETDNIPSHVDVNREEKLSSQKPSSFFPGVQALVSKSHLPLDRNLGSDQQESKEVENTFLYAFDEQYQYAGESGHPLMRQELVHYNSSYEEEDEEGLKASPWLSVQSPVWITHGNLQLHSPGTGAPNTCSDLGLSPSLFSSPARLLPRHILHGGQEELSPVLFEDVYLSPQSSHYPMTLSGTLLRKSAFTLDHCYLSYSEMEESSPSPVSRMNEMPTPWQNYYFQKAANFKSEYPVSSSDENSDCAWVPCKRVRKPSQVSSQKKKKKKKKKGVKKQKHRAGACEKHSGTSPLKLKKKCVNGFIMFCRLNRKHYIRAYPGMASTAATRELAQLWRLMTKQERRPYCLKARRFSRLNNRIVREDFSSGEEELEPPKPLHVLLAEKSLPDARVFGDLSLLELIP